MTISTTPAAPYDYSPITERPPIQWPGGAKVAVYVGLNIEHFLIDRPSTTLVPATTHLVPDALNHGWRDYGARVGIWRTIESLDRHGFRASALINSDVAAHYPQLIDAGPGPGLGLARPRQDQLQPARRPDPGPGARAAHRHRRHHREGGRAAAAGLDGSRV